MARRFILWGKPRRNRPPARARPYADFRYPGLGERWFVVEARASGLIDAIYPLYAKGRRRPVDFIYRVEFDDGSHGFYKAKQMIPSDWAGETALV